MNSHLKPKSLLFYGTMIGGVTILFRVVSGYGETNLKAPPAISGVYLTEQSLPGCPESTQLAVTIQQSGVYLHGALRSIERSENAESQSSPSSAEQDLTLSGLWEQQQVSLSGTALLPETCQVANEVTTTANPEQELSQIPIQIQGTISDTEEAELTGKITLGSSNSVEFTAIRAETTTQSDSGGH